MVEPDKLRRFLAPDSCAVGRTVTLAPEPSHHMTVVLRIGAGDRVRLCTGDGREFLGRVERADSEAAQVRVEDILAADPRECHPITLGFAPPPAQRSDVLVEKAVELGASRLQPFLCERSQGDRARKLAGRLARWERKAQDASPGEPWCPKSANLCPLTTSCGNALRGLRIIADTSSSRPLWRVLEDARAVAPGVVLAIGPAGGFTRRERELAVAGGFIAASLGPTTLRVETAAICLLAAVVLWVDGRGGREG